MLNTEDIKKLNVLVAEADKTYGTILHSSEEQIKRASYKLGLTEAYNDDNEEQLSTMDVQVWLNGIYSDEDRQAGYKRYCDYVLNGATPKYKLEKEKKNPNFREIAWKKYVKDKEDKKAAEEEAKAERKRKREEKKKQKENK